jgi:uncharacterized protein (DUF4213/DUF364 family)
MDILENARVKFIELLKETALSEKIMIQAKGLTAKEAIGTPDRDDFPILIGKEVMIEATYKEGRGQAFTDAPSQNEYTLKEILELPLEDSKNRALLVATINAVLNQMGLSNKTIHCKDKMPSLCSQEIITFLGEKHKDLKKIGLIGLQPAMGEAFANKFGAENVYFTDLNPNTINTYKYNHVKIYDGNVYNEDLIKKSEIVFCTGSTITNGSMNDLIALFEKYDRTYYFFGNTISGVAYLLDLPHICFCDQAL